jgi:hypothetical protein
MTDAHILSAIGDSMHLTPREVEQLRGYEGRLDERAANSAHDLFVELGLVEDRLWGPVLTLKGRAVLRRLGIER